MIDGLRETSERFASWERGFEARDPWPIFVLVVANGADSSSFINPGQYSDFVNDLVSRQATVHAVVLTGQGTAQATTQESNVARRRPRPLASAIGGSAGSFGRGRGSG